MNGEKQSQFMDELNALLIKHGAKLTAEDHFIGYAECGEDVRMTVEFDDYQIGDIDLGRYHEAESK